MRVLVLRPSDHEAIRQGSPSDLPDGGLIGERSERGGCTVKTKMAKRKMQVVPFRPDPESGILPGPLKTTKDAPANELSRNECPPCYSSHFSVALA